MDDETPSLRVQTKKAGGKTGGYFHTLSVRAEKGSQKMVNQYLIPLSPTAETIDAVYISEDVSLFPNDRLSIPQPQPQKHH